MYHNFYFKSFVYFSSWNGERLRSVYGGNCPDSLPCRFHDTTSCCIDASARWDWDLIPNQLNACTVTSIDPCCSTRWNSSISMYSTIISVRSNLEGIRNTWNTRNWIFHGHLRLWCLIGVNTHIFLIIGRIPNHLRATQHPEEGVSVTIVPVMVMSIDSPAFSSNVSSKWSIELQLHAQQKFQLSVCSWIRWHFQQKRIFDKFLQL